MRLMENEDPIARELQAYVAEEVVRRNDVRIDVPLVESGLLDSLGLLQIVAHLDDRYGVKLTEVGTLEDFRTIASLAAAVRREVGRSS